MGECAVLNENPNSTIIKPSLIYGFDDNFFNQFASILNKLPIFPLFGNGETKFQPVYVQDLVNLIVLHINDSDKKNIYDTFKNDFLDTDFAITDLSHSRTIIEIEGDLAREVIKKGCPLNINDLKEGNCSNSIFHAITITLDFISDSPQVIRILALRSFGDSLHHSITDACLEFGYKSI